MLIEGVCETADDCDDADGCAPALVIFDEDATVEIGFVLVVVLVAVVLVLEAVLFTGLVVFLVLLEELFVDVAATLAPLFVLDVFGFTEETFCDEDTLAVPDEAVAADDETFSATITG
ncbi:MAG: hypothetical protein V1489_01020, partial [Candidatus Liptonbacteria bacterium]